MGEQNQMSGLLEVVFRHPERVGWREPCAVANREVGSEAKRSKRGVGGVWTT